MTRIRVLQYRYHKFSDDKITVTIENQYKSHGTQVPYMVFIRDFFISSLFQS